MSKGTDKVRIIALQKALRIAKKVLEEINYSGNTQGVEDALYEINKLDWQSNPPPLQGLLGHGRNCK